jgi:SAM-dependent methyltransferase
MASLGGSCLSCRGDASTSILPYAVRAAHDVDTFGGRRIALCTSCGLQQITPVPDPAALNDYYRGVYRSAGRWTPPDLDRFPYDSAWFLSRGRAVREFVREAAALPRAGGAILDIGAAFGHVLFAFAEDSPDVKLYATEPDPGCASFLAHIGAQVLPHSADGLPEPAPRVGFDLIVMTHVLEHLVSPRRALASLASLLTPTGRVLIEVPNCPFRFAGQWELAPHLSFFDEKSLESCVSGAAGRIERIVVCGPLYNRPTWRDWIPAPARRFVRTHILPRRVVDGEGSAGWEDPRVLPEPVFSEVGADRQWLRALVAFEPRD